MSALARYFNASGKNVAGYDRTTTELTLQLAGEGIPVSYIDEPDLLFKDFTDPSKTLVVFTPAVKEDNKLLAFFRAKHFSILKRSEVLGLLSGEFPRLRFQRTLQFVQRRDQLLADRSNRGHVNRSRNHIVG